MVPLLEARTSTSARGLPGTSPGKVMLGLMRPINRPAYVADGPDDLSAVPVALGPPVAPAKPCMRLRFSLRSASARAASALAWASCFLRSAAFFLASSSLACCSLSFFSFSAFSLANFSLASFSLRSFSACSFSSSFFFSSFCFFSAISASRFCTSGSGSGAGRGAGLGGSGLTGSGSGAGSGSTNAGAACCGMADHNSASAVTTVGCVLQRVARPKATKSRTCAAAARP